jgi:nucleoid DNA-binding protein
MKRKPDLVKDVHRDLKSEGLVTHADQTKKIVDIVINNIRNYIVQGITLELVNFGKFYTKFVKRSNFGKEQTKRWEALFSASPLLKSDLNED